MKLILNSFYILILSLSIAYAQYEGTAGGYSAKHYSVKNYGMHPSNYFITQSKTGMLYFGNAYGVLEYDGTSWNTINVDNGGSGLSMTIASDNTLYIGSHNEFGYTQTIANGSQKYKSLCPKISDAEKNIGGVEKIVEHENNIIYQSLAGLYFYNKKELSIVKPEPQHHFSFSTKIDQTYYVQELGKGLMKVEQNKLKLVEGGSILSNKSIKELFLLANSDLISLQEDGIFVFNKKELKPLNNYTNQVLSQHQITHGVVLKNKSYLITTKENGFYIVNPTGEITNHIGSEQGLESNKIHYSFLDEQGGLWLALDNGISYIEINSAFTFANKSSGVLGMGYTAMLFEGYLYLGTSQGLFYTKWEKSSNHYIFKPVKNITGQIFNLCVINNSLLCCQVDGLYQIIDADAQLIKGNYDASGNWKISPLKNHPSYAIKGTYDGFQLYIQQPNKQWKFSHKISGFEESCRSFMEDKQGTIWMCHGNKGLYKIKLSKDLSKVEKAENYASLKKYAPDFFNDVNLIHEQLVFSSALGPYLFDIKKDEFVKHIALEKIIGESIFLNKIIEDKNKNIWAFNGNDVWLCQKTKNNTYTKTLLKKISGKLVGSYEFVTDISSNIGLIGAQEGFVFYNINNPLTMETQYEALVRSVSAIGFEKDSLLFQGITTGETANWNYALNALRFSYAALFYEQSDKTKYQYALTREGSKGNWSAWTSNTQVEFSNLWEGTYVFNVRAKNIYNKISEEGTYKFTINPPWYRSLCAYLLYFCILILSLLLFYRYIKIRFQKQKERLTLEKKNELLLLEQKHIAENLSQEKEIISLQNKNLEAEVILKNNELANLATTLTQKTEFLSHLKDKLETIHKDSNQIESPVFKEVIKTIDQDLDFDDNWANFQIHFDQSHHNFLHRLREQFPKLNPSWLLLCAYIRMNKSNKEIAGHMNLSLGGVEKRKYRLREKLELDTEVKLSDFIVNY